MGICSSGSTGLPKVIVINRPAVYHDVFSTPMIAMWGPVPHAADDPRRGADVPLDRVHAR